MITLTSEQWQAVSQEQEFPPRVVDPDKHITYVLIREEDYVSMRTLADDEDSDQFIRDMYPHVMKVFGREGWDDPAMDIYDDLDPRKQS